MIRSSIRTGAFKEQSRVSNDLVYIEEREERHGEEEI